MGFAKDHITVIERIAIASRLFVVRDEEKGRKELIGLCPIHNEKNPSFSYNYEKDVYHCLSCQASGDLVDLWCQIHGKTSENGFKDFCQAHDIDSTGHSTRPAAIGARRKKEPPEKEKDYPVIDESIWERMKPLPADWIKRLVETRGWSEEIIKRFDLRMQTVYLDKQTGQLKEIHKPKRVAIPVRNKQGQLLNIRLYQPGATEMKIISWGKGFGSAQLFPAGSELKPDGPVYLVEGEADAICAWSNGLNAITQTSKRVKWPPSHKKHFKNRDVIICYDADQAGQKHAENAAKALADMAKQIRLLTWPKSMGRLPDGEWPADHGEDLTDYFVKHKKNIDGFQSLVSSARLHEQPPEKNLAPLPDGVQFFRKTETGRWTFIARRLAEQIIDDVPLMYEPETGLLYKWNNRFWETFHEDNLKTMAINYLGEESKMQRVSDAVAQAKLLSIIEHGRAVNDQHNWLCLQNVMVDISDLESEDIKTAPHDKKYYATYALNIGLENGFVPIERWLQFLEETIQTPEVIRQIQEFFGYCLTRETRYGKCLFLLGPGSDGKSTLLKILRKLVGDQNCAAVAFRDMEDQFYRSALYNKMLNISTEVGSKAMESMYFKAIVTGDTISAAFKNKTPFDFTPFCKLAFAANRLPRVLDNSDGFFRRVLPVRFKRQFFGQNDDKFLEEKLTAELPGIFLWALAGLKRLRAQGGFTQCKETDDLLMDYKRLNSAILCFVEEKCELGANNEVSKEGLYTEYKSYCDKYGYSRAHQQNFLRELSSVQEGLKQTRPRRNGKRPLMISGISLRGE